ncbi:MAG: hypothetical protein MJ003_00780 [Paludibacteraceae bacterium]|nr:hypothetical protein [Paludibacteraceae bacterium]
MEKDLINIGSQTAKNGFKNERDVVDKFNNWRDDEDARQWLSIMDYDINEVEYVEAVVISGYKADIQVKVSVKLRNAIDVENIQVKLVSNLNGFNQIDKRWIDKYAEMWNMPDEIKTLLKLYTGEIPPMVTSARDKRRTFADEFSCIDQQKLLDWINANKTLIVSDIIKGSGKFAAEWMLVVQKIDTNARWILKPINYCLNFFGSGDALITDKGCFRIGRITMQRKGGDGGRDTAKMLQFKINPAQLFDIQ